MTDLVDLLQSLVIIVLVIVCWLQARLLRRTVEYLWRRPEYGKGDDHGSL